MLPPCWWWLIHLGENGFRWRSVDARARGFDNLRPFFNFPLGERGVLLGRAHEWFKSGCIEPLLYVGKFEQPDCFRVQSCNNFLRRASRRQESVPGAHLMTGHSRRVHGGKIRRRWRALRGGDGESPQFAGFYVLNY